jgi:hypothetical protein
VEKLEPKQHCSVSKIKNRITSDAAIPLVGKDPKELKAGT